MCLYVNEQCIRSVFDKGLGSTPFVKAVDVTLDINRTLEDQGIIKVAITSLPPAFYAALLSYNAADVASKVSDGGIRREMGLRDQDMEGRRVLKLSEPLLL